MSGGAFRAADAPGLSPWRRGLAILALTGVVSQPSAFADNLKETGESLKYQCEGLDRLQGHVTREFDDYNGPRCQGYIQGISDALDGGAFCLPLITLPQRIQTVQSFLATHPGRLKEMAARLVAEALAEVWPCPKSEPAPAPPPAKPKPARKK